MAEATGECVKVAVDGAIAVITVDHRPVNALNQQTMRELDQALEQLEGSAAVKAIVITGAGSLAFVAGADVKELAGLTSAQEAQQASALGQRVFLRLERLSKPVIAAINGVCLGGGLELALSCHMRISGDRARFGQPEITLGIIPGWGGTQRLTRAIGSAKATEWILTGEVVMAQEAFRLGLVNHVVPQDQVLKVARDLARKIAAKGGVAIREALQAIHKGRDLRLEEGLAQETEAFGRVAVTEDSREGIKAFLEKRQPTFKDR